MTPDELDRRLVDLLIERPRVSMLEASRLVGAARGTVEARVERLVRAGVMSLGPSLHPEQFGYPVTAFVTLSIEQRNGPEAIRAGLIAIPQVLEMHSSTGSADLLCKVVARSNVDLQAVLNEMLTIDGVLRTSSSIVLATHLDREPQQLFALTAQSNSESNA